MATVKTHMDTNYRPGMRVKHQSDNNELVYGEVVEVGDDLLFVQWEDLGHPSSYKLEELDTIQPA
jgi:hypothetical protein